MGNKMKLRILSGLCLLMLAIGQDFLITDSQIDASISETSLNLEDANIRVPPPDGLPDYTKQGEWAGVCKTGKEQSPIDITKSTAINQKDVGGTKQDQGYVSFTPSGSLTGYTKNEKEYYTVKPKLGTLPFVVFLSAVDNDATTVSAAFPKSLTFHAPAEHQIKEEKFDLEMQVQFGISKIDTVLSILFKKGAENAELENLDKNASVNLMKLIGTKAITRKVGSLEQKIPYGLGQVYFYKGSVTRPECAEGVQYVVSADVQTLSEAQLKRFTDLFKDVTGGATGNNRDIQQLNNRVVYSYGISSGKMFGIVAFVLALIL